MILPTMTSLTHLSEAYVKPSGMQYSTQGLSCTTNPFWLRSAGPQPSSLFTFPPEPSTGLQSSTQGLSGTTNPFWLRSAGPQPSSLFSYPPEPIHKSFFQALLLQLLLHVGKTYSITQQHIQLLQIHCLPKAICFNKVYPALQSPIEHQLHHQMVNALL